MGISDIFSSKESREKHALSDVIEYDGSGGQLIWKHECENFNTGSTLIVKEGQSAVFLKDGVALKSFTPGRYTLTTQNYPFLTALTRSVTGGKYPFQCAVYFVNKVVSMGVTWGTDSPIRVNDPVYKLPTNITAYGDFSVQVENEKRLLCELVGASTSFAQEDITQYFSGLMAVKIRSLITGALIKQQLSLLGIDAYLDEISKLLLPEIRGIFDEYGIHVKHFVIANIGYSGLEEIEEELHNQTRENIRFTGQLQRDTSQRDFNVDTQIKEGRAAAEVNRELGISELQKQMVDVAKTQAANPGPIMSGNSLGIGYPNAAMGGMFGGGIQASGALATESLKVIAGLSAENPPQPEVPTPQPITVPGIMPGGIPGMMAAAERPHDESSFEACVKRLKLMRDNDLLTEDEFKQQKQALIERIFNGGDTHG